MTDFVTADSTDEQLWEFISSHLGREFDHVWASDSPLLSVDMAERVEWALAARLKDIHQQFEIANMDVQLGNRTEADNCEWKRRAKWMRLLLERRRTQVVPYARRARVTRSQEETKGKNRLVRPVLTRLARAVYDHERAVLNGTDDDHTDEALWALLDELTIWQGEDNTEVSLRSVCETERRDA